MRPRHRRCLRAGETVLERYLIVWLSLLSLLAYFWPAWAPSAPEPFQATRSFLSYLIALIMFSIGCLLPREEIRQVVLRWPTVLGGTAIQYSAMPVLAWSCARLLQLGPEDSLGLILVGCVPGAMASNVLTLVGRGNVSYSVSLTTTATLLSPLVVPIALYLALRAVAPIDPVEVSLKLLREVVGPVLAGYLLCRRVPRFETSARRIAPVAANLAILWIIAVVVALNRDHLGQVGGRVLFALLTVNLLGYLAGYTGGGLLRLPKGMRRALTLEVGMQNAGLGTVLALTLFPSQPTAAIPPAAYTFGCMFTGTLLAQYWRLHPGGDETPDPASPGERGESPILPHSSRPESGRASR